MKICPKCGEQFDVTDNIFCPMDGTRLTFIDPNITPQFLSEIEDKLIGQIISDRYRVVRKIGEGGMGVVYEVEHILIEKKLALKLLREDYASKPELVARFRQEAISASKIGHQNIIDVTDFGTIKDGSVYFVMEHLDGEDLASIIKKEKILDMDRGIPIIMQICRALYAAHSKGIIHRDMKPENVFLIEKDENKDFVKVLDFGIAKMSDLGGASEEGSKRLTKTGIIFGTPEYMSPEQAAGKKFDHRVDIYATGIIMYEMFTGTVPFQGDTFMSILSQQLFDDPPTMKEVNPNLSIPHNLELVIYKSLAKDPEERYPNMKVLMEDVERAVNGAEISVTSSPYEIDSITDTLKSDNKTLGVGSNRQEFSEEIYTPRKKHVITLIISAIMLIIVMISLGLFLAYKYIYLPKDTNNNKITTNHPDKIISKIDNNIEINNKLLDKTIETKTVEKIQIEKLAKVSIITPQGAKISIEGRDETYQGPIEIELPVNNEYKITADIKGKTITQQIYIDQNTEKISIKLFPSSGQTKTITNNNTNNTKNQNNTKNTKNLDFDKLKNPFEQQ